MVFVWGCSECARVYDGESVLFLYTNEEDWYCPCGGRLVEGLAPEGERRYRLTIPGNLRGTPLHRQLEELSAAEERVEVACGRREDLHISLFSQDE